MLKTVGTSGQISLGRKYAGQHFAFANRYIRKSASRNFPAKRNAPWAVR
jgi:hypothetical protein